MSEIIEFVAFVVRTCFWTITTFIAFVFKRVLDLFGLICFGLSCCTIVRLPFIIKQLANRMSFKIWRLFGFFQIILFIIDIPILLMFLFIGIFSVGLLYIPLFDKFSRKWKFMKGEFYKWEDIYYEGCYHRRKIIKFFFRHLFDLFVTIPMMLILFLSWRCMKVYKIVKNSPLSSWLNRFKIIIQFLNLCVDILCAPFFLAIVCSWRLPTLIAQSKTVKRDENGKESTRFGLSRGTLFLIFFLLLLDIVSLLLLIIICMSWRLPCLIMGCRNAWKRSPDESQNPTTIKDVKLTIYHIKVFSTFWRLCIDIFCSPFVFLVLISWRSPLLYFKYKHFEQHPAKIIISKVTSVELFAIGQSLLLFVDLLQFLVFLILLITWRNFSLVREIKKVWPRDVLTYSVIHKAEVGIRKAVLLELLLFVLEVPLFLFFLLLILLPIRLPHVILQIYTYSERKGRNISQCGFRKIIFFNFMLLLMTIIAAPCLLFCIIAFWRFLSIKRSKHAPSTFKQLFIMKRSQEFKFFKVIIRNFLMIFVDIIAFIIAIFLFLTIIRAKSLFSTLISPSFRREGILIVVVVQELVKFVVDLFFILVFLLLCILRPITAWVCLLEDEEHKEAALIDRCHRSVPYLIESLKNYQLILEDDYTNYTIKNVVGKHEQLDAFKRYQTNAYKLCHKYTKQFDKIIESFPDENEYSHLVRCLLRLERERPLRLCTKLMIELQYLKDGSSRWHDRNVMRFDNNMIQYEAEVSALAKTLLAFKIPKPPLYRDQSGFSTRTREETQRTLIDALPRGGFFILLLALLNIVLVYRAPTFIRALYQRWYARNDVIFKFIKEYALDFLTIFNALLIIVTIILFPSMFSDVYYALFVQGSWNAARKVINQYPKRLLRQILNVIKLIFSYQPIRYTAAAVVLLLLGPAELLLHVLKTIKPDAKCSRFLTVAILHPLLSVFPFLIFYLFPRYFDEVHLAYIILAYVVCLWVLIFLFTVALYKNTKDKSVFHAPKVEVLLLNWTSINVVIHELLEFIQLAALVSLIYFTTVASNSESYNVFRYVFDYVLLNFIPIKYKLVIAFACVLAWYFIFITPPVLDKVLNKKKEEFFNYNASFQFLVFTFSNTLFVTICEALVSCFACTKKEVSNAGDGNKTTIWVLADDESQQCWTEEQKLFGSIALFGLFYYLFTTILFAMKCQIPKSVNTLRCSPFYEILINFLKIAIIGVILLCNFIDSFIILQITITALLFLFFSLTLLFKPIFGLEVSTLPSFAVWRVASFFYLTCLSILYLVAFKLDDSIPFVKTNLLPLAGGLLGVLLVTVTIVSILLRSSSESEKDRDVFVEKILKLEASLRKDGHMNKYFWVNKQQFKQWKRLINKVRLSGIERQCPSYEEVMTYRGADLDVNLVLDADVVNEDRRVSTSELEMMEAPPSYEASVLENGLLDHTSTSLTEDEAPVYTETVKTTPLSSLLRTRYWNLSNYERKRCKALHKDIMDTCGQMLLIDFELNIRYNTFSYKGLTTELALWRERVYTSDWASMKARLEELVELLQKNLNVVPRDYILSTSPFEYEVETFKCEDAPVAPLVGPEEKLALSNQCINSLMQFVETVIDNEDQRELLKKLFEKILPRSQKSGFIKEIDCSVDDKSFTVFLHKKVTGCITKVGPNGVELAKGAKISLPESLAIKMSCILSKDRLNGLELSFTGSKPVAHKIVTLTVSAVELFYSEDKQNWYLSTEGKKIQFEKALDTVDQIIWK